MFNMQLHPCSPTNRICDDREIAVERCLQMKIPELLEVERAEHSELLQEVEKLLKDDIELWREKDSLETSTRDLNSEIDSLRKNINKVARDISAYKKVTNGASGIEPLPLSYTPHNSRTDVSPGPGVDGV